LPGNGSRRVAAQTGAIPAKIMKLWTTRKLAGMAPAERYPCALTDAMWQVVSARLPVRDPARGGRPLKYDHRLIID